MGWQAWVMTIHDLMSLYASCLASPFWLKVAMEGMCLCVLTMETADVVEACPVHAASLATA
eukprot:6169167-Karenia_brevis.AAC.1